MGKVVSIQKPPKEPHGDWRDTLVYTKDGTIAKVVANAVAILSNDPAWAGVLASDIFAGEREIIMKAPPWDADAAPPSPPKAGSPWTDADDVRTAVWLQRHWSLHLATELVGAALRVVAKRNPTHPVRQYLDSLKWDGTRRLPTWLSKYIGAGHNDYTAAVGQWFLISAVARVRKPGCKADHVPVLEGAQGKRKSTALRVLASDEWFTDEISALGSKDSFMELAGRWIVEMPELDAMSKAEVGRIKAFLSATTDRYRPPYGRRVVSVPRQCVIAGTVNLDEYFRDDTGNRRFWPVRVGEIDVDALARDRDQLWAEADEAFKGGAQWWPTSAETPMVTDEQEQRFVADAWEGRIADWLITRMTDFTTGDVLSGPLGLEPGKWGRPDQMRVASCLRRLRCTKERSMRDASREWRWSKPKSA